jgi:hypothetical protein
MIRDFDIQPHPTFSYRLGAFFSNPSMSLKMEGFDTMTMSYLASPLALTNMQAADYLNAIPGMDMPEQRSNFDTETFVRYKNQTKFKILVGILPVV